MWRWLLNAKGRLQNRNTHESLFKVLLSHLKEAHLTCVQRAKDTAQHANSELDPHCFMYVIMLTRVLKEGQPNYFYYTASVHF